MIGFNSENPHPLLALHQIASLDRFHLEDRCRELAQPVFLGGSRALCRILGRYKFFVDTNDRGFGANVLMDGFWEMWLTQFMARFVKPGMIVADVGANFGYYSLLLADLVGSEGRLHCFEPNPTAVAFLTDSIALNGFHARTEIHTVALGAADGGAVSLFVPHGEPKNAHVMAPGAQTARAAGETHSVPVRSLDSVLSGAGKLNFIKIDAEGAEQDIIEGMMERIASDRPAIILEFNAARYHDAAGFLARILQHYGSAKYVDYTADLVSVSPYVVTSEKYGEDWLLFFGSV